MHIFFPLHKFEQYSWQCNNDNRTSSKKRNERYQYRSLNKMDNKPNIAKREKLKSYINM